MELEIFSQKVSVSTQQVAFTKVVGLYKVPLKSRIVGKYYPNI
jgi:hypothetical protein